MRTSEQLKWLLIDFDDTIAKNTGYPDYKLIEPLDGAYTALKRFAEHGFKVTVYTARPWNEYELIEDFMKKYGLEYRRIICGKPLGRWIVDDRNKEFKNNWDELVDELLLEKIE